MTMSPWVRGAGVVLAIATGFGLLFGILYSIFGGGFYALWREGNAAGWPWWYYVLAVPVFGAGVLLVEGVGEAIGAVLFAPFTWRHDPSSGKRAAYWIYALVTASVAVALFSSPWWLGALGNANAL